MTPSAPRPRRKWPLAVLALAAGLAVAAGVRGAASGPTWALPGDVVEGSGPEPAAVPGDRAARGSGAGATGTAAGEVPGSGATAPVPAVAGTAPNGGPPPAGGTPTPGAPAPNSAVAPAAPVPPPADARVADLRERLDRVLDGARWRRVQWSVMAVSLDRGDTLYARDGGQSLAPASNMKIMTSAAALHHLGPDFRYVTWVLADGPVEEGVVQGDLVLYGTGDPALSDRFFRNDREVFRRLARELRDQGIQAVAGDLVGDGTYYEGPSVEASWDPRDVNEWFAAPVSALSFNENVLSLRLEPAGWVGAPPRIQTVPDRAGVPIENQARTVGVAPEAYRRIAVIRASHEEPIQVVGEIQAGATELWREMTVSHPPLFAATVFQQVLEAEGIEVYGRTRGLEDGEPSPLPRNAVWGPALDGRSPPRIVAQHHSPPLSELLEVVNNESHNLFAETVFRSLGAAVTGRASFAGGTAAVHRFLVERAGLDATGLVQVDGSGLSASNRASAGHFVQLIRHMAETDLWEAFLETLPEAGNRRELGRMYRSAAAGNLRAKTGTIERVSSLSGVVTSASGERIAFSILANGVPSAYRAKRLEDRIGVALADFDRP